MIGSLFFFNVTSLVVSSTDWVPGDQLGSCCSRSEKMAAWDNVWRALPPPGSLSPAQAASSSLSPIYFQSFPLLPGQYARVTHTNLSYSFFHHYSCSSLFHKGLLQLSPQSQPSYIPTLKLHLPLL